MTPEIGQRFERGGSTYVITSVKGSQDELNALIEQSRGEKRVVQSECVTITAERLDLLERQAGRLNALLDAHEVDRRADS